MKVTKQKRDKLVKFVFKAFVKKREKCVKYQYMPIFMSPDSYWYHNLNAITVESKLRFTCRHTENNRKDQWLIAVHTNCLGPHGYNIIRWHSSNILSLYDYGCLLSVNLPKSTNPGQRYRAKVRLLIFPQPDILDILIGLLHHVVTNSHEHGIIANWYLSVNL